MVCLLSVSVAIVAIFVGLQTLFSKWRPIRVFISYQHSNKDLVDELATSMKSTLLKLDFVPFEPSDHDKVIQTVRKKIQGSDAIVVLPGLEKSFVDAEILAASTLLRPILLLHHDKMQTTPDTAFSGYPIFKLSELRRHGFQPLERFITHITGSWRDKIRDFDRVSTGFGERFAAMVFYIFVTGVVTRFFTDILGAISIHWGFYVGITFWWIVVTVMLLFYNYSYLTTVVERFRAIRVARQVIPTGKLSFELLFNGLKYLEGDRNILECLEKEPLELRHGKTDLNK